MAKKEVDHWFAKYDNPMKAVRGGGLMRLLSTHPPTEERIERLTRMAQGVR